MQTFLFTACDERQAEWTSQVRLRLSDAHCAHELHTAYARYHDDCRKSFTGARNMAAAKKQATRVNDTAYSELIKMMRTDC